MLADIYVRISSPTCIISPYRGTLRLKFAWLTSVFSNKTCAIVVELLLFPIISTKFHF
jgi:hypothetical protein